MEGLHLCEKCKKPILPANEQIKENKYYHKKCLNPENTDKDESEKKNFVHERRLTTNLKTRYSNDYLGKTLMTEVVRPYYQFKFKIKKSNYLELVPKIALYFHDLEEDQAKEFIKNNGMEKLKLELKELFGEDASITFDNITYGSLLTNICIFYKKMKSKGKKALKKLGELFTHKKEETKKVKEVVDLIESHTFKCLENLRPSTVKFVNQKKLEDNKTYEQEINNFLEEQITKDYDAKSNWSLENKVTEENLDDKEFKEEEFDTLFANIKSLAENQELELNEEIKNIKSTENFNNALNLHLEKAFKESIFEFRIIGLVLNNKEEQKIKYEEKKKIVLI